MTPTIYQATPPPWKEGGSQVEQWESGLIRVTQSYMVPREDRESIAASNFARGSELTGINSPATGSIYIYPDPTIDDMNNGFSKITVTAYGRAEGAYSADMTYVIEGVTDGVEIIDYYCPQYRIKWVTTRGESPAPDFLEDIKILDPIYLVGNEGSTNAPFIGGRSYTFETSPSTNFGVFQERVFTFTALPILTL